jgi:hypothetical protein
MADTTVATAALLNGVPPVNIAENLRVALDDGRRMSAILREIVTLRRAAGKLAPSEYFYYRLWDPRLSLGDKRRFVGKQAQHRMHVACNDPHWYQTAADKILFHTIMAGAGLPVPDVVAVTQPGRALRGAASLDQPDEISAFLRNPTVYPLFAKPAAGKYSLNVISAESYDRATDSLVLLGGAHQPVPMTAQAIAEGAGYVLQPRLRPAAEIETLFGPRLWSIRLLVFIRPGGPHIHRAVAKIATGTNPADNYWRAGNMLGAVEVSCGRIAGVVRGTGSTMRRDEAHPDTGRAVIGFEVPHWSRLYALAREAAAVFPGIRTQSWDIALTDQGPILLEVNFGGDLKLAQLAEGRGVLDDEYRAHLRQCGFER